MNQSTATKKRIVIIGAGSAGLVALKTLRETKQYKRGEWELTTFERREGLGGIWLPEPSPPDLPEIPQTPLYNSLTTNLPHPIMAFRDFPFPPSTPLYPAHPVVLQYLKDYAKRFELEQHIQYSTSVVSATRHEGKWRITAQTTDSSGLTSTEVWEDVDSLLVTIGRCCRPFIPRIPGIEVWLGSKANHSVSYREPTTYAGKRVIVIGNGPSAVDLAPEIAGVAERVWQSVRGKTIGKKGAKEAELCAEIKSFGDIHKGEVRLVDGTVLEGIDYVVFGTGYRISCPFFQPPLMQEGYPPSSGSDDSEPWLYDSGHHIFPISRHLFPTHPSFPPGSLFFFGFPRPVVPFPLTEAQALLVSSVLSGSIQIDIEAERKLVTDKEKELLEIFAGDVKQVAEQWHMLPEGLQFDYRESLIRLAGLEVEVEKFVPAWQRRIYENKKELRAIWKALEKSGEGERCVKDVGKGGEQEWVALMDKLIAMGESPSGAGIVEGVEDRI